MNLLDLLKQIFGGNFAALASNVLGASESNTKSAVTSMIPALLGSLVQKGSTPQGASSLLNMINSPQVDSGIVGNMSQLLGGGGNVNQLVNTGSGLINSLFGSNAGPLGNALASMSGLSGSDLQASCAWSPLSFRRAEKACRRAWPQHQWFDVAPRRPGELGSERN